MKSHYHRKLLINARPEKWPVTSNGGNATYQDLANLTARAGANHKVGSRPRHSCGAELPASYRRVTSENQK